MERIGLIGAGFMGTSLAAAVRTARADIKIGVVEKDTERRAAAVRRLGAEDFTDRPQELLRESDLVILAVKPQDLEATAIACGTETPRAILLSVLAGTPAARVAAAFGGVPVVRIMPNLAAEIGQAVTGISYPDTLSEDLRQEIASLLKPSGTLIDVPERLISAVTGLSGSGIAFAFQFIHALAMGGTAEGVAYPQALRAAIDVTASAAALLAHNGVHPEEMVSRVCSPAGTTIAGVRSLADGGFTATVMDAVSAAARRSREIEG